MDDRPLPFRARLLTQVIWPCNLLLCLCHPPLGVFFMVVNVGVLRARSLGTIFCLCDRAKPLALRSLMQARPSMPPPAGVSAVCSLGCGYSCLLGFRERRTGMTRTTFVRPALSFAL